MNKWWGIVLGALFGVGCGSPDAGELFPPEEPASVESEAKAQKVRTICADEVARELDPTLDDMITDALLFWQDQPGVEGLRHEPGESCDVPVTFTGEGDWEGYQAARATVQGKWKPGCKPLKVEIREANWGILGEEGWQEPVLFHELGHLLCLAHAETGIMRFDASLGTD